MDPSIAKFYFKTRSMFKRIKIVPKFGFDELRLRFHTMLTQKSQNSISHSQHHTTWMRHYGLGKVQELRRELFSRLRQGRASRPLLDTVSQLRLSQFCKQAPEKLKLNDR
ncbi:unnamed protein product [Nesidiocoris tenuis]|uniref:Uncharacterized protein n=1 Tax=Nesidiocoris tenuis TaxID=355587 RepID=A0A6H5H7K9_9HEMI|nr:unnamed protein product [Nesidiocoris tenuis]